MVLLFAGLIYAYAAEPKQEPPDDLYDEFVQRLIVETQSRSRHWYPIQPVTEEDVNENLYYTLFEDEWHRIDYKTSYYLSFMNGFIYLVDEWEGSGRDGTTFDGYNLYVQPTTADELTLVMSNTKELDVLIDAISADRQPNKAAENFMKAFIDA